MSDQHTPDATGRGQRRRRPRRGHPGESKLGGLHDHHASKGRAKREATGERLLDIEGLSKSFGTVHANRDITMHVERGEIVALLGENGAGKSTLVKQIFGLQSPDAGTITIKGDATPIKDPKDAIRRGIGMVHQHFQLVPVMTVAENIILGHETVSGRLDLECARTMVGSCPRSTASPSTRTPRSRTCRSAPSSGSRSSRPSRARSTCSSSTSRPPCSPPRRPTSSSASCASSPTAARRSSSSPTSCARCSRPPTGSTSCARARSWARSTTSQDRLPRPRLAHGRP